MKITSQEEYGLRCLLQLASAGDGHSLTIPEIAAAEGLSSPYVAKLLSVLRHSGLIDSVRGRAGGYRLATNPVEISLGAVMKALGEPLFDDPGYCQRHAGTDSPGHCVHHDSCSLRGLWQTLEHWMRHALDHITLADLMQNEHRLNDLVRSRLADALAEPASPLITLNTIARA